MSQENVPCLPGLTWLTVVSHLKALSRWPQGAAAPVANLSLIAVVLPHGAVVCRDCAQTEQRTWFYPVHNCQGVTNTHDIKSFNITGQKLVWKKLHAGGYWLTRGLSRMIFTNHRGQGGKQF